MTCLTECPKCEISYIKGRHHSCPPGTHTGEAIRCAEQLLSVLVMDLGYTHDPEYGFSPLRHRVAWGNVVDVLGEEKVDSMVSNMVKCDNDALNVFPGFKDTVLDAISTLKRVEETLKNQRTRLMMDGIEVSDQEKIPSAALGESRFDIHAYIGCERAKHD